jgi:hypothetical protein
MTIVLITDACNTPTPNKEYIRAASLLGDEAAIQSFEIIDTELLSDLDISVNAALIGVTTEEALEMFMRLNKSEKIVITRLKDTMSSDFEIIKLANDYNVNAAWFVNNKQADIAWVLYDSSTKNFSILDTTATAKDSKNVVLVPGQWTTMQRSTTGKEMLLVLGGNASVYTIDASSDLELHGRYQSLEHTIIPTNFWYQITNEGVTPATITVTSHDLSHI